MSESTNTTFAIHLTPIYTNQGAAAHIAVKLVVGGLSGGLPRGSQSDGSIKDALCFTRQSEAVDGNEAADAVIENIHAVDEDGELHVRIDAVPLPPLKAWKVDRPVKGEVTITYDAIPVDGEKEVWNQRSLHKDSDGLVGVGSSFIPTFNVDGHCDVAIVWDLSRCPAGARAVSSLGEGNVVKNLDRNSLQDCIFMVGPVKSFPSDPPSATAQTSGGFCATYWLGALPENLSALADFSGNMFPHLSSFFGDENGSYRAFLRKVPRGLRGLPLLSSSLIDYDEDAKDEHDWELVRLLNSSMISTWARLDPEEDGSDNDWFTKGISHLYSIYLPYRFGQRTPDYFRATLNGYLSSYFTNPRTTLPLPSSSSSSSLPPAAWHAASVPAIRGCVYMIRTDCFTRRASVAGNKGVARPIDEIVAELCARRRRGEKARRADWLACVGEWIGQDAAREHFDKMQAGSLMDLEDMKTSFGGIDPVEQRVMEMGFAMESLATKVIAGVAQGSRAFQAGLRDGDNLLWTSRLGLCETDYERKVKIKVLRGGEELEIEYWPRGEALVRVWQSFKKETK